MVAKNQNICLFTNEFLVKESLFSSSEQETFKMCVCWQYKLYVGVTCAVKRNVLTPPNNFSCFDFVIAWILLVAIYLTLSSLFLVWIWLELSHIVLLFATRSCKGNNTSKASDLAYAISHVSPNVLQNCSSFWSRIFTTVSWKASSSSGGCSAKHFLHATKKKQL